MPAATITAPHGNLAAAPDLLRAGLGWLEQGKKITLASVTQTWGSAPRPVGSHLIINEDGDFLGSVSGGCVEGAVVSEALEMMQTGAPSQPKLLSFGVADAAAWEVGLSCGGKISVYLNPIDRARAEVLAALITAEATRMPALTLTHLETGAMRLISEQNAAMDPQYPLFAEALQAGRSCTLGADHERFFLSLYRPVLKMCIIGAVHVSQHLVSFARALDIACDITDPRTAFATKARFPDVNIHACWPDESPAVQNLDAHTAFVALTHDPKIDDPALRAALKAGCFYIGALGSRKTHAARCARLIDAGCEEALLSHIHAPIGLDIGAVSPAEIALSILAEIIAAHRNISAATLNSGKNS